MNRKLAAVLLAATMLATPALAAGVDSSSNPPATKTETPAKAAKTSDVGAKKQRVHARTSHKVRHAKHVKQVKHAHRVSKKSVTTTGKGTDAKAMEIAPVKAPAKN